MRIEKTDIDGLLILEPKVFSDSRGSFFEAYNHHRFREATGLNPNWLQDNESISSKDVLRGLHFQIPPFAQDKLVRVSQGAVLDVAVDLRKSSPSFGKYFAIELSSANKLQLFIPSGFAHGFLVLEEHTIFSYKCSQVYSATHEHSVRWNDDSIGIDWGIENPILSEKDAEAPNLSEFQNPFG